MKYEGDKPANGKTSRGLRGIFKRIADLIGRSKGDSKRQNRGYSYLLEFRCRGRLIFSEKTDLLGDCVKIGHAPENDWVIPDEDKSAADFHARLNLGRKEITLLACKGKNFRYKGKVATSRKLRPNDRISIGDCELFVSSTEHSSDLPCDVHRLEFLNGPRAGEMMRLEKPEIRIGSLDDNDIVINDDVVSGHHAELKISEDAETWLKDLGSQNGTYVNGARMGRSERMLMDSDIISIAFYDLRFLDRNVIHTRTNASKKFFAVLVTALITVVGFGLFYAFTPRSEDILSLYDKQLKNNNFDGAKVLLAQLPYSREFGKFASEYPEYRSELSRYETVFEVYNKFKEYLASSNWAKATSCIGLLNLDNQVDWNWDESKAAEYMKEAAHAKACLIQMYNLSNILSDTDLPAERMIQELSKIEKTPFAAPDFGKSEPDYLKPLCGDISRKLSDLRKNVGNLKKLDATLNAINWESADIQKLILQIDAIKHDSMGAVRAKAQNAQELLAKIESNINAVKANQEHFYNLEFDKISADINFISADECLNYVAISNLRSEIAKRNGLILKNVGALKYIISDLGQYGINGGLPKVIERFNSRKTWESLLEFKSLNKPAAPHAKDTFADEYDELLGFKYFYDIISQVQSLSTNLFSTEILLPEEYHPKCILLCETYKAAEEAFLWFRIPENKWMLKGKIKDLQKNVCDILSSRDNLLKILDSISKENPDGRKFFVSKAAYFYFASPGSISKDEIDAFTKKWRVFRQRQYATWEKSNPIDSERMKDIAADILSNGIPGDPIVNQVWK